MPPKYFHAEIRDFQNCEASLRVVPDTACSVGDSQLRRLKQQGRAIEQRAESFLRNSVENLDRGTRSGKAEVLEALKPNKQSAENKPKQNSKKVEEKRPLPVNLSSQASKFLNCFCRHHVIVPDLLERKVAVGATWVSRKASSG